MKLPNVNQAIILEEKFTSYLLDETHVEGRGKALFFKMHGFSIDKWITLAQALVEHARTHDVVKLEQTKFGTRYVVEGRLVTPVQREPRVRVVWFVRNDEVFPRLVTAYPLEESDD